MRDRKECPSRAVGPVRIFLLALLVSLFAPSTARAQTPYKIQPVARLLDSVGEAQITLDGWFEVGDLTDRGQLHFVTLSLNDAGGKNLLQFADGKFIAIALPGGRVLDRTWPLDLDFHSPISANETGSVVFAATAQMGGKNVFGTFLWTDGSQQITAIALAGMPAVNDLTLETGARYAPAINGGGEIVFGAQVKDAAGQAGEALFFRDGEGKLLPAALPGQELPGGGTLTGLGGPPSLNDAGMVAFLAVRSGDSAPGAYLWPGPREAGDGALGPVALVGAETPGGGKIERVTGVWVNDRNRTALVAARVAGNSGTSDTLFRFTDGQLTPAVASGQEMPGGGKLQSLQPFGISRANAAGQHAFLAYLEGNATAAYLLDADGKLSLILKEGDTTEPGRITQIGGRPEEPTSSFGVGLNGKGQVALPVRIAGGSSTLVLLTPAPATP